MGTNRCTFTWNGYIIKCAVEVAGTIDNKKEFEIANKLQQYVCQIYEITEMHRNAPKFIYGDIRCI